MSNNDGVLLNVFPEVRVKPNTNLNVSYGYSPGENPSISYNTATTVFIEETQNGVRYRLFAGITPTGDAIREENGNGSTLSLATEKLTKNSDFCVVANKDDTLEVVLKQTATVIVIPNPNIDIEASSTLIDYNTATKIQVLKSQPTIIYKIVNGLGDEVKGNGGTILLPTDNLVDDTTFQVEAINPTDEGPKITLTDTTTVSVRPDASIQLHIPTLPEQEPEDVSGSVKEVTVIENRQLTIKIDTPQTGITYQLWKVGEDKPDFTEGEQLKSAVLTGNASFQVLATKAQDNDTTLQETVEVTIAPQVVLDPGNTPDQTPGVIYYGTTASVKVKATETEKIYTLYKKEGDDDWERQNSLPGTTENNGEITLKTLALQKDATIKVTQQLTGDTNLEEELAEFSITVTPRISVTPNPAFYNRPVEIVLGAPVSNAVYQLRYDANNALVPNASGSSNDSTTPIKLNTKNLTQATVYNILETSDGKATEITPTIVVQVIPQFSLEQNFIPYKTAAVIKIGDSENGTNYRLDIDDNTITHEKKYDPDTKVTTLTTEEITSEGSNTINITPDSGDSGTVKLEVALRINTTDPSFEYGGQASIEIADTEDSKTYYLYKSDGSEISTTSSFDEATKVTTLITSVRAGLINSATYKVKEDTAEIGIVNILIKAQVTTYTPRISYKSTAKIKVAASKNSSSYQLIANETNMGSPQNGNGTTLEFTSDSLLTDTVFKVKEKEGTSEIGTVNVEVAEQAYSQSPEVAYRVIDEEELVIMVTAPDKNVTYHAKHDGNVYTQRDQGDDKEVSIPIDQELTKETTFNVYYDGNGGMPTPVNDVKIAVTHQLVERKVQISDDYHGSVFLRVGASTAPDKTDSDEDGTPPVTEITEYQLREDADNHNVGLSQEGTSDELVFTIDTAPTSDTLYNIKYTSYNVGEFPDPTDYKEFKVSVVRESNLQNTLTLSTPVVAYDDGLVVTLEEAQNPDKLYEILNNQGAVLAAGAGSSGGTVTYNQPAGLSEDTTYIARISDTIPDENGQVLLQIVGKQTVMVGRLQFHGTSDYVYFKDLNDDLQIRESQTIEMWVRATTPAHTELQTLYDKSPAAEGTTSIDTTGKPTYKYDDGSQRTVTADHALADNTWTHIAMVRNSVSDQSQWYVNGVADNNTTPFTGIIATTTNGARIGAQRIAEDINAVHQSFTGLIAEVRIWNTARTQAEIDETMNRRLETSEIDSTLVAYWKMDEMQGLEINDSSRSSNTITGTLNGASWDGGDAPALHRVIEEEIIIDSEVKVEIHVENSLSEDTQYQLVFANNGDNIASGSEKGTGSTLSLITTDPIEEDVYLKVMATKGSISEEVGVVKITHQETHQIITTSLQGKAMVSYREKVTVEVEGVADQEPVELYLNDNYGTPLDTATGNGSTIELTISGDAVTRDIHDAVVRSGQNNGKTVFITKVPEIMVGLLSFDNSKSPVKNVSILNNKNTFSFTSDQDFSVEFWINGSVTQSNNFAPIISNNDFSDWANDGFIIFFHTEKICAYIRDDGNSVDKPPKDKLLECSTPINDDQWYHVVAVFNRTASKISMYIDGNDSVELTYAITSTKDFDAPVYLMSNKATNYICSGILSNVRIWDTALTKNEIVANKDKRLSGTESHLIGYWKLDEGQDAKANDTTDNDNDGTIQNAEWLNE
ncbi:MAG: hypothetical protein GKR88_10935 [Flavobacteriaceae bacterium]|nr:MAG: hypothetical protein GKR88_10935 [Flavobacteriaceae bacterium]